MARTYARILTSIWRDPDFVTLSQTAQWLYVVILSEPKLSSVGVVAVAVRRWASLAASTTSAEVDVALMELQNRGYVIHDEKTEEVMVRTFLRYDGAVAEPHRFAHAVRRDFAQVISTTLRDAILEELAEDADNLLAARVPAGTIRNPLSVNRSSLRSVVTEQGEAGLKGDEGAVDPRLEALCARVDKAVELLARRDLEAAVARGTEVGNRKAYLAKLRLTRAQIDWPTIFEFAVEHPDWSAGVLAGAIQPVPPRVAEYRPDDGGDR